MTLGRQLLVFRQPEHPAAGLQVPTGAVEPGETPDAAVLCEAREETGLEGLELRRRLGVHELDARHHGRDEIHERHVDHLVWTGPSRRSWSHLETGGGRSAPARCEFHWHDPATGAPSLTAEFDAFLDALALEPAPEA